MSVTIPPKKKNKTAKAMKETKKFIAIPARDTNISSRTGFLKFLGLRCSWILMEIKLNHINLLIFNKFLRSSIKYLFQTVLIFFKF